MGVALAALGTMWHTASQREKERDLLFVGDQYRPRHRVLLDRAAAGWHAAAAAKEFR